MMRVTFVLAGLLLVLAAAPARSQEDAVVHAARDLVTAAASPADAGRVERIREAGEGLERALAAWDRSLEALNASTRTRLNTASPERAFQLHVELGMAYRSRGRFTDALREFDAAAALQPNHSDLQMLRGVMLEEVRLSFDFAQDTPSASRGVKADTTDDQVRLKAATAEAFARAWRLDPANPTKAYYALQRRGLTTADERTRSLRVMEETYRRLKGGDSRRLTTPFATIDVLPDWVSPVPIVGDERTATGFALLAAGRYSDGVLALAGGQSRGAQESPLAHFQRAQVLEADGQIAEARREYTAALTGALAGRSVIYVAIARLARVDGDMAQAITAYSRAVQLNPQDPNVRLELANAYAAAGDPDAAFVELVGGLLIVPAAAPLHAAIGQLRLETDRPEDAIAAFTRALELNPNQYELRYALATALTRVGRSDEATAQLQIFERVRRELLERRRKTIQDEVDREDTLRRRTP